MNGKYKLLVILISFLLLIPFRLPVAVVLIKIFNWVAQLGGTELGYNVLLPNIILTKLVYNIIFSTILIMNVENQIRAYKGRKALDGREERPLYVLSVLLIIALFAYTIFDCATVVDIFKVIQS